MTEAVPDLVTLRILAAIGATGTFGRAAESVGLSQQAASSRIRAAESLLGFTLVDRTPQGSALTPRGRLVAEWAAPVLEAADHLALSLRSLRPSASAVLTVAASQTIAEHFLPRWMAAFQERAGAGATLRLASGNSAFVIDQVRRGEAAIGLIETPEIPNDLASATIREDSLVVVVSPQHPWAARAEPLAAAELAATPLIVREAGSGTRRTLELALNALGQEQPMPEPRAVLSTTSAIRAAVAAGVAPAVVSLATVEDDLARGILRRVPVTGLALTRPLTALWRRSLPLPPLAEDLFATLRA
ncbi:putative HTH-type transcriptional regulator [Frondihabitans sp. 762G35]|uniref:LysR family transcriptional regulator n=1 Tax=Frondihabitans sp. 762G35 TaxID=1446794 RepID=UPI000D211EBB|nr:LysR substrate-binding domain-containing protein [Frondihabitans sp. 762G35]ARC58325.1 putative HTH-type transcriptional regulator [Frondihabitans sp. 762G35]